MKDNYNKASRVAYIKLNTEGFAYELYLLNKYKTKKDINITMQLYEYLECGWELTEKEEKAMIKNAIKIVRKKYFMDIPNKVNTSKIN